jgi:hypothetical protein
MKSPATIAAAILLLAATPLLADPAATAPAIPKELLNIINTAIKLIETEKYEELITTVAHPSDVAKMKKEQDFAQVAKNFGQHKAKTLLAILKAIKNQTPTLNDDQSRASFAVADEFEDAPKRTIDFIKVEGAWYLKN